MAGKSAILTLKILGDAKDAQKALEDTSGSAGKMQGAIKGAAVPAAAALAGLAAAGLDAASAAAEDEAAQAQLALAMRNSAGANDEAVASMETWISKTSKATAVADDELRPALGTLVRATGDVGSAQDLMTTALDVSAATGKDLGTTTDALAKAYGGQTTSLKKLVPGMDDAVLASGDMNAIMDELARTTGGAAAEAAGTAEGKVAGMKIAMDEAKESIGSALLPVMENLATAMTDAANFVEEHKTEVVILAGAIAALAAGILIANVALNAYKAIQLAIKVATVIWTGVQWALNSALLANPITWIVLLIVGLIAAIVLIATKTTWFQDAWNTAWKAIKAAAKAVWDWLGGAAEAALNIVKKAIDPVKKAFEAVGDAIESVINWLKKIQVPQALKDIGSALSNLNPFKSMFKTGPQSLGTVAVVGAPTLSTRAASSSKSSGGGVTINVNGALDPTAVARQIRSILRNDDRRRNGVRIGVA